MTFYYNQHNSEHDIEYLQYELERYREYEQRREEEAQESRRQREQERKERYEYEMRTAETWPEALEKQTSLMAYEAEYEREEDFKYGSFFTDSIRACNRALEIWREVEGNKQEKIHELERQLEAIQDEIRLEVAEKLRSDNKNQGWQSIAASLENDEDLYNWLSW